jgi:hypothetical protein
MIDHTNMLLSSFHKSLFPQKLQKIDLFRKNNNTRYAKPEFESYLGFDDDMHVEDNTQDDRRR